MEKRNKNMMLVATLLLATSITLNAAEEAPSRFAFLQNIPGVAKVSKAVASARATLADMQNPESYGPRDGRSIAQQGKDAGTAALAGLKTAKDAVVSAPSAAFSGLKSTLSTLWTNLDVTVSAPFVAQQLWNQIPDAYKAMALEHVPSTFPGRDKLALAATYAGSFKASQVASAGLSKGFDWAQSLVASSWVKRIETAVDGKIFSKIPGLNRVEGPYRKVLSVLSAYVIWTKVVLPLIRSNRFGQWTETKLTSFVALLIAQLPTFGRAAAPAPEQPEPVPGQPVPVPTSAPTAPKKAAHASTPTTPKQQAPATAPRNFLLGRLKKQPAAPAVSTEKTELTHLASISNEELATQQTPLAEAIKGLHVTGTFATYFTGESLNFAGVNQLKANVTGNHSDLAKEIIILRAIMQNARRFSIKAQDGCWNSIVQAMKERLDKLQ